MSTSSVLCTPPRYVYAGIIYNKTSHPVLCTIHYTSKSNNNHEESISVKIDSGGQACIPEREYRPMSNATFACRKIVSRIDVHGDKQSFSLEQPFDGVTCPVTEWKFDIHDKYIASVNPNFQTKTVGSQ